ncbi:MCT family MFS transporter PWA37_004608 [Arxiozyma heterogenica]|uniref:Uncharacterized protein n=1 Tax=Arxiozyma heterogenica TaxID=278026 RepID=A0AAN7WQI8_9SACH|nr:hypothetical protein RI543_000893 [Kazachstania heterogenica]
MAESIRKGKYSGDFELYAISSLRSDISTSIKSFQHADIPDYHTSNHETPENSENELNRILTERFDVGDAIRLEANEYDFHNLSNKTTNRICHTNTDNLKNMEDIEKKSISSQGEEKTILERVFTNKSTGEVVLPPDKGYAWVMVFAVILVMLSSWGCNAAFGVFLSFYLTNGTFPNATKYDYAIIAGIPVALGQGLAPLGLILMRIIGLRTTMLVGTMFLLAGFLWASFATQLWELYVSQGVFIGISISLVANPPTTCIPGWFLKKRAAAMGLCYLGTGLGGLMYGLASNKMIQDYNGTSMCYRMLAVTCTVSCLISICIVKERIPSKITGLRSKKAIVMEFKKFFDIDVIKKPTVLLIAMWFNLAIFAYTLMVFTLSAYAVARGMSQHQGSTLTSLLNAGQTVGRPIMGLMGDKFGRVNVTSFLTCILCIYIFAFWIPAHTFVQLIFFSIMMGLSVGVANVMNSVLIADVVKPEEFLPAWGFVTYSGSPLFLVSELIAQALTVPEKKNNPYIHTQIFTGFCFFGALLLSFVLREKVVTIKLQQEVKKIEDKINEYEKSDRLGSCMNIIQETGENAGYDSNFLSKLEDTKDKYNHLLGSGWKNIIKRVTYPTKI